MCSKKKNVFSMGNFSTFSNSHRYTLEKGSKKHHCPNCNKKTFVLYIDTETGDYLPEQYGRCDRESKCSHYLNPYLDGYAKAIQDQERGITESTESTVQKNILFHTQPKPQPQPEPVFFDFETFKQTLQPERYEKNTFIQNLFYRVQFPFEVDEVTKVVQLYRLGTVANGYRAGANTFPFIDIKGNVRAVQVKQFDEQNHTTGTDFLHSIIEKHYTQNDKPLPEWLEAYTSQDKRVSCLFGEHLLSKYPNNPIALVEAPKTAIYSTLYLGFPEQPTNFLWLAVYNKSSFSFDKLKVLKGRFVYVFPDLSKDGSTFKEWETKAKEYESRLPGTRFIFSDLLEQLAPKRDKTKGNDIADYLIKLDWRLFRKRNIQEQPPQPEPKEITESTESTVQENILFSHVELNKHGYPKSWDNVLLQNKIERESDLQNFINTLGLELETVTAPKNKKQQADGWSNDIAELETYFISIEFQQQPIKLNNYSTISDCSLFIERHLSVLKANNKNKLFFPFLKRLNDLKKRLVSEKDTLETRQ